MQTFHQQFSPVNNTTLAHQRSKLVVERATNSLYGGAIGDALGGRYEFDREELLESDLAFYSQNATNTFSNSIQKGPALLPILGGGIWDLVPGQITDDTEMAMALASSLLQFGPITHEKTHLSELIARNYHRWYKSEPFDIGQATKNAVSHKTAEEMIAAAALYDNKCKRNFGSPNLSNGMLMRIAPLAISLIPTLDTSPNFTDSRELYDHIVSIVSQDTSLTHASPEALNFSVIYIILLAFAIRDGSLCSGIEFVRNCADKATGDAFKIFEAGLNPKSKLAHSPRTLIGDVRIAFQLAIRKACLVESGKLSFTEALISTIRLGGDTNAAIVGYLCGSIAPSHEIPDEWKESVRTAVGKDRERRDLQHSPNKLLRNLEDLAYRLINPT
jgi:ADP-ribosyl-[dinitrogen reductase] hydrolase